MAMNSLLYLPKPHFPPPFRTHPKASPALKVLESIWYPPRPENHGGSTLSGSDDLPASAAELPLLDPLQLSEPANALSLPTWAIHVSSVVEWVTAMVSVWQYGEKSGFESWKGLSWGMDVWFPLLVEHSAHALGNSFITLSLLSAILVLFHELYVLVALQAALTVIGNATMCIAAFRIYRYSEERSKKLRSFYT